MKRFSPLSLYLDARHSTSARVFLSIFVSVCLVSLILLSAYSINAMQEMNALSQANGQNVVDTISRQVESFVEDISAMHSLFFSSENILPFLSHSLEEMPSYEWFMDYQAAKRILTICGRSQYSLVNGLRLQKGNGETMQYGSLAYVPDPSQMQQGKLVIDHGYAFFTTSSPLSGGGRTYLTSQLFNAAFDRLCEGLLMPGSGLMILDQQGNPFLRYADNARATEEMDGWLQHGGESQSFSLVKCVSPLSGLTVAMLVPSVTFSAAMADILPWLMPAGLLALLFGLLLSFGFSHRIGDARNDGKILIQAERKGELLRISVTDNGQGMSAEQIEALLRQDSNTNKQRFSGIGLYNVRKRIQMRFGEPSGLQIVSKPGLYTSVVLSLPYQKEHAQ